jgi:putative tricarboxylic transport membrane protein
MEQNLRRALSITNGELSILWGSPITIGLWVAAAAMLLLPPLYRRWQRSRAASI